jgi:hypothetical protein
MPLGKRHRQCDVILHLPDRHDGLPKLTFLGRTILERYRRTAICV